MIYRISEQRIAPLVTVHPRIHREAKRENGEIVIRGKSWHSTDVDFSILANSYALALAEVHPRS